VIDIKQSVPANFGDDLDCEALLKAGVRNEALRKARIGLLAWSVGNGGARLCHLPLD
jgi:hypothetical protein